MDKATLRTIYLEKRLQLSADEVAIKSTAIKGLLFSSLPIHRFDKVHCYLPANNQKEVDTQPILETLFKDFPTSVYVPKVVDKGVLEHHIFEKKTKTTLNKWEIPEPTNEGASSETFFNNEEDILVIVPLLAFDKKGHRVGYGKGFYDRFLAYKSEKTCLVGLSFFDGVAGIEGIEKLDIPMNFVVTPKNIYTF